MQKMFQTKSMLFVGQFYMLRFHNTVLYLFIIYFFIHLAVDYSGVRY